MDFESGFQDISDVRWQRVSKFGSSAAENSATHGAGSAGREADDLREQGSERYGGVTTIHI